MVKAALGFAPPTWMLITAPVALAEAGRVDGANLAIRGTSAGGLTALGAKNLRARGAEARLVGRKLTKDAIAESSSAAAKECEPTDDPLRGSAKYKREMAALFTTRALELAAARARRAGGGSAR